MCALPWQTSYEPRMMILLIGVQEKDMKENIHPQYVGTTVTCACGNTIETGSTMGDFRIDICNECHPFYTGKQRQVQVAGRVEKFNRKYRRK